MNWEDLKTFVGTAGDADDTYVEQCWDEARLMVLHFVGLTVVPASILDRATLEVGSELYHRKNAPNGIAQFNTFDGSAVRVARDPMVGAYPILQRYTGLGFA